MKHRIRSALANTPLKLIAVVLLAVLVPSVLLTALGLIEVFEADAFVRDRFRQPISDRLAELGKALTKAWQRRLLTYETYLQGSGDRSLYLARLRERDAAVRDVIVAGPTRLRLVDSKQPWRLGEHTLPPELRQLCELELSQKDLPAALAEAQRLLASVPRDEVQVELLLTAARLNERLGAPDDALENLLWALERYGQTSTPLGIVRAVPILLRMAEIESQQRSREALLMRLPQVADALRQYGRFMPAATTAYFEARLEALCARTCEI